MKIDDLVTVYDYDLKDLRRTQIRAFYIFDAKGAFLVYPSHHHHIYKMDDEHLSWIRGWNLNQMQKEAFEAAAALLK